MKDIKELDLELIENALKNGIRIIQDGTITDSPGATCLVFHPILKEYVLVFGSNAQNAGFVRLDEEKITWERK